MQDKSIIIIGAGIAGLCAGVYARLNGYRCKIIEMHSLPGGLCTSWQRRGYTIDGCIHWLVGSSPTNGLHRLWQEVGLVQNREFVDSDTYFVFEDTQGRRFHLYADPNRLERHMLELAPQDAGAIREFMQGVRFATNFNPPAGGKEGLAGALEGIGFMLSLLPRMGAFRKWMKTSAQSFSERFTDPLLRMALKEMWIEDFSIFFMLVTMAYLYRKEAGYPIGGSMPMIKAVEARYTALGGEVQYDTRVEKILVENDRAVGVRLADGSEQRADWVISAADGHATIFDMLEGKYIDDTIRGYYNNWSIFQPLVFVGLGVNRTFEDEPISVTGISYILQEPITIAGVERRMINVHLYNQDPTMAPPGKTALTVMFESRHAFWKELHANREAYEAEKKCIAETVVRCLEQRWPGISAQVEMIDVATPVTFERYTGNWQGSMEGWLMTPDNIMTRMKKTLPGLQNFYMVGQWVAPGGGLPSGVMTAREVQGMICKADKKKFSARVD